MQKVSDHEKSALASVESAKDAEGEERDAFLAEANVYALLALAAATEQVAVR
jgi:hypothetical protein